MRTVLIALVVLMAACAPQADAQLDLELAVSEIEVPSDSASGEPHLLSTDGRVALSWIERSAQSHEMRFAYMDESGWGAPRTIALGQNWFVNWADVPSIAASGDLMWAHWLEYNGAGRYAYGVRVSSSQDGGQTWGPPEWLHEDRSAAEHGFVAMTAFRDRFHAVWLDGRKWADDVHEMTVQARSLGQPFGDEIEIDGRTCECCPNDIATIGGDGLIAAYRNRDEDETRNIHVVRYLDGAWEEPKAVNDDGWQVAGCPVNGPALDAHDQRVVIAWFTAPNDDPRVNVAFSSDGGASFDEPIRVDSGGAIGRVDVVLLDDGTAIASWIEASGGSREDAGIVARRVSSDGRLSVQQTVVPTSGSRASGYPRMVRHGQDLIFAWTAVGDLRHVRSARVSVSL